MRLPIVSILRLDNEDIYSLRRQDRNQYELRTAQGQCIEAGAFERTRTESTSRTQGFNDLQPLPAPKWSSVRTIRLLFNGTRLFFDLTQLTLNLLHDNAIVDIMVDFSVVGSLPIHVSQIRKRTQVDQNQAGFLVLWDLLEKFCLKSDSPYTTASKTSISIEVAIPFGIVVLMYFVISYQDKSSLELNSSIAIDISATLLWVPVV